jgi:hypothetical protein
MAVAPIQDPEVERVRKIARVLDTYMVDPIVGLLLPGVGDLIGTALGLYAVALAVRRKMSPLIVARMLLNLSFDAVLGALPLLGDAADFAFRANQRNVKLLEDRSSTGGKASWKDWAAVVGAALLLVAVLGLVAYAIGALFRWIF